MARKVWPEAVSYSQSALMYYLTHPENRPRVRDALRNAHSAAEDVKFCRFILKNILHRHPVESWEALWMFSEASRIPDVMPFGKHKGIFMGDLPKDYVRWALKNLSDMDEYLRAALEKVA